MKKIVLLLVVTLVLPTPAVAFDRAGFKADIAWVIAAGTADVLSTRYMLSTCATCYERNPWLESNLELKKALGSALILGLFYVVRRQGYDGLATWLRWGLVVLWSGWSSWNMYLAERR